jgi:hypothetical protein
VRLRVVLDQLAFDAAVALWFVFVVVLDAFDPPSPLPPEERPDGREQ